MLVCPHPGVTPARSRRRVPQPGPTGGYPGQVQMMGGGTPRYLPPPVQVRMGQRGYPKVPTRYAKVHTPHPGQDEGYPKVSTPCQGTYPHPGQDGVEGVPQGTYPLPRYLPPSRSGWGGGGTPRYLLLPRYLSPNPGQDGGHSQDTYPLPRYLSPIQVKMRGRCTLRYLPRQGTYPPAKVPTPHWDRTAYGVLDMLQLVYLLRSRRRTFLLTLRVPVGTTVSFAVFSLSTERNAPCLAYNSRN